MSTKLEAMVGLLAGRAAEPALLEELADPSSEASRFLEATRARSKALFAGPTGAEPPKASPPGRGGMIAVALLAVAALVAFAATLRVVDGRFRLLEARSEARDAEARAQARRVEEALGRLVEPAGVAETSSEALRRIEAGLDRVEARPPPTAADPSAGRLREEVAALRRELASAEQAGARRDEEVQAAVHDAARVLRLLLGRLDPPAPGTDSTPVFTPPRPPGGGEPRRPKP